MTGKSKHQYSRGFRSVAVVIGLLGSRKLRHRISRPPTRELSSATTLFAYILLLLRSHLRALAGHGAHCTSLQPWHCQHALQRATFSHRQLNRFLSAETRACEPIMLWLVISFLTLDEIKQRMLRRSSDTSRPHVLRLDMLRLFQAFIKPT